MTLLANLDGEPTAEPRTIRFLPGIRRKSWINNVVAIGLSSGFIEPLESTSIHVIQTAINRLLELMPAGEIDQATRDDFNSRTRTEMEGIRDFVAFHYHCNQRVGEPFWDGLRKMTVPEPLQRKIDLFQASARLYTRTDELFDARAWIQVMIGQNLYPESYNPLADLLPEPRLREFLDGLERAHVEEVSRWPDHGAFIARFAPVDRELVTA